MRNTITAGLYSQELRLLHACYKDVACASGLTPASQSRDLQTCKERLDKEGLSFLTVTLPLLGKYLDKILSTPRDLQGDIPPLDGFAKRRLEDGTPSRIPKLFGDLVSLVITDAGVERSDASVQAFGALRQLTGLFYKTRYPMTKANEEKVISSFLRTEEELMSSPEEILGSLDALSRSDLDTARRLVARILSVYDPFDHERIVPRHGPGSVATGEQTYEKPVFRRYYRKLHSSFPYDIYMSYNLTSTSDNWESWQDLQLFEAGTAKVVLVPKDSRGPRLISCEPLEYQWVQQGVNRYLVDILEDKNSLSSGFVNFEDQTVNRDLALHASLREGSVVRERDRFVVKLPLPTDMVTLDMKDASDRVSCALVELLFPENWCEALFAARSYATKLPDGKIVPLKKFAPMGSAICFPIEALVFWALSCAVMHNRAFGKKRGFSRKTLSSSPCYVYGDDIILPKLYAEDVMRLLESVDLKVNRDKCCLGLSFRESCGMDAYQGVCVTPVRFREPPTSSFAGMTLFSWAATHNMFSSLGYFNVCDEIQQMLASARIVLPFVEVEHSDNSGFCHLVDPRKCVVAENRANGVRFRFNRKYQRREILALRGNVPIREFTIPGWAEMLRIYSVRRNTKPPVWDSEVPQSWLPSKVLTDDGRAYQYTLARRVTRKRCWLPYF